MSEIEDPEDRLIRRILIAVPTIAALGFLAMVVLITVMVSYNFNILDWLE
jgi:bacteriorhodopsin